MAQGWKPTVANSLLDAALKAVSYTGSSTIWVQLHTGTPGVAGTSNPAGNTTRHSTTFNSASGGISTNAASLTWSGGEVNTSEDYTFVSLWNAATAGSFIMSGGETSNPVTAGQTFTIAAGAITASLLVAA